MLPIYVLTAPALVLRQKKMVAHLSAAGSDEVTFVQCANRDAVAALTPFERGCLYHPAYNPMEPPAFRRSISNGSISIALKHRIALYDLLSRRDTPPAAIVLEDDAVVTPNFWARLSAHAIPFDADIFFLGSYGYGATSLRKYREPVATGGEAYGTPAVHWRDPCSQKKHQYSARQISSVAYAVWRPAAAAMLGTIRSTTDTWLSVQQCGKSDACDTCSDARRQYGPSDWIVGHESVGSRSYDTA